MHKDVCWSAIYNSGKKNPATEVLNGMRVEVVGMTEQMENCCYWG